MEDLPDNVTSIDKGREIRVVRGLLSQLETMYKNGGGVFQEYR